MASADLRFPEDCDPTLPGYADPYPYYHALRAADPVHWSEFMQGWVITRHADAVVYLKDRRFSRAAYLQKMRAEFGAAEPIFAFQAHELAFTDPPEHTWMKNVFGKAFSPAAIARMRPATEEIVRAKLDTLAGRTEIDIVAEVAYPIPADVIAAMLGAPAQEWEHLRELVDGIVVSRGIVRTPQMMEEGSRSVRRFNDYFIGLLAERRRSPADDLLSAILVAEENGRKLSDEQVLSMVETLFAAGHATTRSLIANGMLALLKHPARTQEAARESRADRERGGGNAALRIAHSGAVAAGRPRKHSIGWQGHWAGRHRDRVVRRGQSRSGAISRSRSLRLRTRGQRTSRLLDGSPLLPRGQSRTPRSPDRDQRDSRALSQHSTSWGRARVAQDGTLSWTHILDG
jgi:cytochrome P450